MSLKVTKYQFQVVYTVRIDGELIDSVPNTDARVFNDVKVFAGDDFYPPTDGSYSNLIWWCPAGWSEFEGECYKFVPETKVWSQARADCLSQQVKFYYCSSSPF